ncbi:MAG TPA: hypothetical protein VK766_03250, partial [Cytophagaceae bacterium]|nr:hypothetical protein [Cytophagaceae bacterium]
MKEKRNVAGLVILFFLFSNLLIAEADREMLVKRWKVVKHQKSGKGMPLTSDDFIQLANDGMYEHSLNRYYAKGSWALNADELTINNNGEYNWKIVSITEMNMSLKRGVDEIMELEKVTMPASVNANASPNIKHLCMGKWRPNEHHKGSEVIKTMPSDRFDFYVDGTFEQIQNGIYSKGKWSYNKGETELTINEVVW